MIQRENYQIVFKRLEEPRHFIQALVGPRQVGKTTLALQKINEWSTLVKRLWDEDTRKKRSLKVLVLGSAPLLIQHGLSESLAGRFEMIPIRHWTYKEMQTAFQWNIEQYIYYGGYPGAASLIQDETRWKQYIINSLIETTISKDILSLSVIQKPALLRQLFYLGCIYSGQILSYQKLTGQLQDAGNTTTLSHYLDLISAAGLICGLNKYAGQRIRQRGSSPKFQVQNTALLSATSAYTFVEAQQNRDFWGRLVESAIGAYLINQIVGKNIQLFYWREEHQEVDFILQSGKKLIAIEVKSGKTKETLSGIEVFRKKFKPYRLLLVGGQGIQIEQFLTTTVEKWFLD